jgi:hypothetical protein
VAPQIVPIPFGGDGLRCRQPPSPQPKGDGLRCHEPPPALLRPAAKARPPRRHRTKRCLTARRGPCGRRRCAARLVDPRVNDTDVIY